VSSAVTAFVERVEKIERAVQELPVPKDGKDGIDGKSVTVDELEPFVRECISQCVSELPPAKDGKDGENGVDGLDGKSITVDDVLPTIKGWFDELPRPVDGKDGKDGIDGKSITIDEVRPLITAAVEQIPKPKDGKNGTGVTVDDVLPQIKAWFDVLPKPKDGKDGTDGKSVTLDDVRDLHESLFAKWQLDWERRAMEVNQRCLDRFEKPKNGKDGLDGLGFDDMTETFDGRRTWTRRYTRGDEVKEFTWKVPALIECGVWIHGKEYEQGDGVTCGGNYWIALVDTKARPGENNSDWRLAVRKGRDGKDAR
jgi:hypothetical protein